MSFIGREKVGTATGINNVEKHHDGCFLPHTVQCTVLHEFTRKKTKLFTQFINRKKDIVHAQNILKRQFCDEQTNSV